MDDRGPEEVTPDRDTPHAATSEASILNSDQQFPLTWRELFAVLAILVLGDVALFRGNGYAGAAVFLAAFPVLLLIGRYRSRMSLLLGVMFVLLAMMTVRLIWLGSVGHLLLTTLLSLAIACSLNGGFPYLHRVALFAPMTSALGALRLKQIEEALRRSKIGHNYSSAMINVGIPVGVASLFSIIFLLANPDLVRFASESLGDLIASLWDYVSHFSIWEPLFWIALGWFTLGCMSRYDILDQVDHDAKHTSTAPQPARLFAAARNSLLLVIVLFAAYLIFEFQTLWFREFPDGFYYSGYAHQGSAWLTLALALSTLVLSLIFRGPILQDYRVGGLKTLAWIWSVENFLLAIAVYNRLTIYVGFNGMTRMRIVGYLGITAVVLGFLLVVWKVARNHRFSWLIKRQIMVPVLLAYLFAMLPNDALITRYNVRRIMAGDLAPAVQISVQPLPPDAVMYLEPLLECDNEFIRNGVAAIWIQERDDLWDRVREMKQLGWTNYQSVPILALNRIEQAQTDNRLELKDPATALELFERYVYQWY